MDPLDDVEVTCAADHFDPLDLIEIVAEEAGGKTGEKKVLVLASTRRQSKRKKKARHDAKLFADGFRARIDLQCLHAARPEPEALVMTAKEIDRKIIIETSFTLGLQRIPRRALEATWQDTNKIVGALVGFDGPEHLLPRKKLHSAKLTCANFCLHRQFEVIDALMHFNLEAVNYAAEGINADSGEDLVAAQGWVWDEATQSACMHSSLPITLEYLNAVREGKSTKGIPMSVLQQVGHICVDSISTGHRARRHFIVVVWLAGQMNIYIYIYIYIYI
jgi:hypothetical protein